MSKIHLTRKGRRELKQYMVYLGVFCILTIIVMLFRINVVAVITSIVLMIVASFSKIYKRFTSISFGFELVTPTVILFAYKIDVLFSLLAAFIMLMAASFIAGKVDFPAIFSEMITYTILAILVLFFRGAPFVSLTVVMIVLRNVILFPLGLYLLGRDFIRMGIVIITDIICNVLIVLKVGEFIVGLY